MGMARPVHGSGPPHLCRQLYSEDGSYGRQEKRVEMRGMACCYISFCAALAVAEESGTRNRPYLDSRAGSVDLQATVRDDCVLVLGRASSLSREEQEQPHLKS